MKYYFWLPFALLVSACADPKGKVIAKIPEASGLSYCSKDDTLVVANDEGAYYKINRNWRVGGFWYGQWHEYEYEHFDKFDGADITGEQTLFFSNAEVRLGYEFK